MKKIVLGALLLAVLGVASFTGTRAFFSVTETSNANAFMAGSLDMEVAQTNSTPENSLGNSTYAEWTANKALFSYQGLIPGDSSSADWALKPTQESWACLMSDVTANSKSMKDHVEIAYWNDVNNNGLYNPGQGERINSFQLTDENTWFPIEDVSGTVGNNGVPTDGSYRAGYAYCFGEFERDSSGNLVISSNLPVCDGSSVTNTQQGGTVEATLHFYAEQKQNNNNFRCSDIGLPAPTLVAENFNTHDDSYYTGFNVGWNQHNFGTVSSIVVDVEFQDGTHVKRTSDQGVLHLANNGGTVFSVPFIAVSGGDYTTVGDINTNNGQPYWQVQTHTTHDSVWGMNNPPVSVTITVTGSNGTKSVTNTSLTEPDGITWESLFN